MNLSKRKLDVLSAIVKSYIKTGEPIGSKNLTSLIENSPSSATLRNEMNALCGLGFLSQPHTSAGRTPTSSAYKLYVTDLMKPQDLKDQTKDYINNRMAEAGYDTENIPKTAAETLYKLTGYPVITYNYVDDNVFVKQVKLLPISRKTAVVLLILSDGRTKNSICQLPAGFSAAITAEFARIITKSVKGKNLHDLTRAYLQSIIASVGINALNLTPLFTTLFGMAQTASQSAVDLHGASSLYNFCSDEQARQIIMLANAQTALDKVLSSTDKKSDMIFGNDTCHPELKDTVMITSEYYCKDKFCGKIGIIGPHRIDYEQIIPDIDYIAKKITVLMTNAVNDMED